MAGLALKSVMYAAEKVPDHWFEKIPGGYYRPKDDKDKKKHKRRSRRHDESDRRSDDYDDDYDNGYASEGYEDDRGRHGQRNDHGDDTHSERSHRGRRTRGQSMGGRRDFDDGRYEAPLGGVYGRPRSYNPADYAAVDARDAHYASRQGGDGTRYVAPGYAAGAAAAYQMEPSRASSSSSSGPTAGYVPYADVYGSEQGQQPRQTKLERDSERHPHARSYKPVYQSDNPYAADPYALNSGARYALDDYYRKGRDTSPPRHKSRTRQRAKSSIRDQFDVSEKGLTYGTIGAVAGGLGANAYESRDRARSKGHRFSKYDDKYNDRYNDRYSRRDDDHYSRRDDDRYGGRDDYGRRGGNKRSSRQDGYYSG